MSVTRPMFGKHKATFYTEIPRAPIHEVLIVFASSPPLLQFVRTHEPGMWLWM